MSAQRKLRVRLLMLALLVVSNVCLVYWYHKTHEIEHIDAIIETLGILNKQLLKGGVASEGYIDHHHRKTRNETIILRPVGLDRLSRSTEEHFLRKNEDIVSDIPRPDDDDDHSVNDDISEDGKDDDMDLDPVDLDGDDDNDAFSKENEAGNFELEVSDYNASSLVSKAWIPMVVQAGAYTTHRWKLATKQTLNELGRKNASRVCRVTDDSICDGIECRDTSQYVAHPVGSSSLYSAPPCKTLWITGWMMNEDCDQALLDYSAALASAKYFAPQTLQPVVLLAVTKPNLQVKHVRNYLQQQGVIVIQIGRLSFQDFIIYWHQIGKLSLNITDLIVPYWSLDLPRILAAHNLFSFRGLCERHVLFTNPNILFVNPISHADLNQLKAKIGAETTSYMMYETTSETLSSYPMVMLMDAVRFYPMWQKFLEFRHAGAGKMDTVNQWLAKFFDKGKNKAKRQSLSDNWNWHVQWDSAEHPDIKLVQNIAALWKQGSACNAALPGVKLAICCDRGGVMSLRLQDLLAVLQPDRRDVCPNTAERIAAVAKKMI